MGRVLEAVVRSMQCCMHERSAKLGPLFTFDPMGGAAVWRQKIPDQLHHPPAAVYKYKNRSSPADLEVFLLWSACALKYWQGVGRGHGYLTDWISSIEGSMRMLEINSPDFKASIYFRSVQCHQKAVRQLSDMLSRDFDPDPMALTMHEGTAAADPKFKRLTSAGLLH